MMDKSKNRSETLRGMHWNHIQVIGQLDLKFNEARRTSIKMLLTPKMWNSPKNQYADPSKGRKCNTGNLLLDPDLVKLVAEESKVNWKMNKQSYRQCSGGYSGDGNYSHV